MPTDPMSIQDFTNSLKSLSLAELQQMLAGTEAAIAERRVEELKVLADGYAKKLAMNGFSIREGMDALKPYLPRNMRG
jgi:DNA-binding protein H-NS